MNFLADNIDKYVGDHSQQEPILLKELNKETWQKVLNPRMLNAPLNIRGFNTFCQVSLFNSFKSKGSCWE